MKNRNKKKKIVRKIFRAVMEMEVEMEKIERMEITPEMVIIAHANRALVEARQLHK